MKTSKNKSKSRKNKTKRIYKKSEYNSGDGMLTSVWGPSMWHYLHTMSFNYPVKPTPEDKKHYKEFILSLQHVLPCKYCRINLKKNFSCIYHLTAKHMESRDTVFLDMYTIYMKL